MCYLSISVCSSWCSDSTHLVSKYLPMVFSLPVMCRLACLPTDCIALSHFMATTVLVMAMIAKFLAVLPAVLRYIAETWTILDINIELNGFSATVMQGITKMADPAQLMLFWTSLFVYESWNQYFEVSIMILRLPA